MYKSWLIISDVGGAPDYLGKWPKLAVAHVISEYKIGPLSLGNSSFCVEVTTPDTTQIKSITCDIQYFNDSDDPREPNSRGTIAKLDVSPLYGEKNCPVQICCDEISEAEFGTHIAFDTLPELEVIPLENKT